MSFEKPLERILITKEKFLEIENQIRLQAHIMRYASIRRFAYGKVLDFACGCGYGSYLVSKNPDVESITGVDKDETSINWASKEFVSEKCHFRNVDVLTLKEKFDTLISLETIEHFDSDIIYTELLENCQIDQVILSYPNKKSTHFNPYHLRDLKIQDICSSFEDFMLFHSFSIGDVTFLLLIRRPKKMLHHITENLIDLKF